MRIDLHAHSTASDGTDPPSGVVEAARAAGLDAVALTDHDSTARWDEAADAARRLDVRLVPGAEISCSAGGISVHLLSYLHDPTFAPLLDELDRTRDDRLSRARRIVGLVDRDYPLGWDEVLAQVPVGATVGRPHIADALVAAGHVRDRDQAFEEILYTGSPYYARHYAPDAREAVRLVVRAGGVPVMAHPRAGRRGRVVSDDVIADLVAAGMAGLEADHRDHTDAERAALRGLAADLGVFVTGSSDYHGTGKANALGENTTAPEVFERIVALGRGTAVVGR